MARVVFLGTPAFGVPVLQALVRCHEVVAVVTQPDRIAGRGRAHYQTPAVKQCAVAHALPVWQPISLRRNNEVVAALRHAEADVFVIAAFGQMLRPEVLSLPRHGCIGVHASLLPRLRGAAPIARAILQGDQETGVTLMLTDPGMDTGASIAQRSLAIAADDTTETLGDKLSQVGAALLIETLPAWLAGQIVAQPQDDTQATSAPPIDKTEGAIAWPRTAQEIDRQIRAFTPWPGAFSHLEGRTLKIVRAHPLPRADQAMPPGAIVESPEGIGVVTGCGLLALDIVQLEGKKALSAREFARGQRSFVGSVLA